MASPPPVSPKAGVLAAALAAAIGVAAFVSPWEGRSLLPYKDIVGVWTVCDGITRNVQQRRYTHAECDAMLEDEVAIHLRGLDACIQPELKENEWIAVGSLGFNAGVSAICKSTMVRMINAGRPAYEWCREILRWDRAGGRKVKGLTRRRQAEFRVCMGES